MKSFNYTFLVLNLLFSPTENIYSQSNAAKIIRMDRRF